MTRSDRNPASFSIEYIQIRDVLLPNLMLETVPYANGKAASKNTLYLKSEVLKRNWQ